MKRILITSLALMLSPTLVQSGYAGSLEKQSQSVVKLFTTHQKWDILQPWTKQRPKSSTCTGFVIDQGVLTNAHCIADATYIQVEASGQTAKIEAQIVAVNHQIDLALLSLARDIDGARPIEFGDMSEHRQAVVTVGYPAGGKQISYTEGIVSRIDVMGYAHSSMPSLMVQTDAAINPGNSGGPVFDERRGTCIGVATQKNRGGEGLGYFIPVPTINQFLTDIKDSKVDGIANLGISFQRLENDAIRSFFSMPDDATGVRVREIAAGSSADGLLQTDDILTHIEGERVYNTGEIDFNDHNKISLGYKIYQRQVGERIKVTVWRDGASVDIELTLKPYTFSLIPAMPVYDQQPRYMLVGGILIMPIEASHVWRFGGRRGRSLPANIELYRSMPIGTDGLAEMIAVAHIYADTSTKGYGNEMLYVRIASINGIDIHNFDDARKAVEGQSLLSIELEDGRLLVVDTADGDIQQMRERYNLPSE